MAHIFPVHGTTPEFGPETFLAPSATITGNVIMGAQCSVWFNAVIRGDVNSIRIGHRVNIQDNAVVHCTFQKASTKIGNDVSIGHNAIIHGCEIHDQVLVGMGAIVMDHCIIESNSIIAAGAVLLEGTHVPAGSLYAGIPARKVKDLDAIETRKRLIELAQNYTRYSGWYTT